MITSGDSIDAKTAVSMNLATDAVPAEGLAITGIFGDASKLADAVLRYPVAVSTR